MTCFLISTQLQGLFWSICITSLESNGMTKQNYRNIVAFLSLNISMRLTIMPAVPIINMLMLPYFCVIVGYSRNQTVHNGSCPISPINTFQPNCRIFDAMFSSSDENESKTWYLSQDCQNESRKIIKFITIIVNLFH